MKNFLLLFLLLFSQFSWSQDYAKQQLENAPRHHEWVTVTHGERKVQCFVAYPEVAVKTPAVLVIHENRGLNDWARSFTDQVAAAGYLAIAPDLLSGFSEEFPETKAFPTSDDARSAIYELDPEQVTADLNAVVTHIARDPACTGQVSVIGFCWGGSQSFRLATNNQAIQQALVFYGTAPKGADELARIEVPVYGFYGGNDQRVNATIEPTDSIMRAHHKVYQYEIYEGAGHAFMRRGDDPEGEEANVKARNQAWIRIKELLGK